MNKYVGQKCPYCHARFFEDDDIAICPDCGAPHHRECFNSSKKCGFVELHGTENQWTPPVAKAEQTSSSSENTHERHGDFTGHTCPHCGRMSTSDTLFCPGCGYNFDKNQSKPNFGQNQAGAPHTSFGGGGFNIPSPIMLDPLGGVSPTDAIDDIPVIDVATFVGANTRRYIPLFHRFSKTKSKANWNWAGFFFHGYWLLSKKCYAAGIIALLIDFIAVVFLGPTALTYSNVLSTLPSSATQTQMVSSVLARLGSNSTIITTLIIAIVVSIALRVYLGVFGDVIYKNHVIFKINKIKKETDSTNYQAELIRNGRINLLFPVVGYIAIYLLQLIFYQILSNTHFY